MTMPTSKRPLSPHLQVYRLPFTALTSISHRITGALLILGALYVAAWIISAALGPEEYAFVTSLLDNTIGTYVMIGWSLALYYHLCNGVRHLIWDTGLMLKQKSAYMAGYIVILTALMLTFLTWAHVFSGEGAVQ